MSGLKVLYVDDEPDIREIAVLALELDSEIEVRSASSGAAALQKAAEWRPDAILLDVMMPDMDGPTTFRRLQAHPATREIPVIFLTAKVQAAERKGFAELGVHGVLAKPFDPMALSRDVAQLLGWEP